MLAIIPSATVLGVDGHPVTVEVHISDGLPGFTIVGLPDTTVREARDRVRAALISSGCPWPLKRITVNLAPGWLRKGGAGLDLPIAVGVLVAGGELRADQLEGLAFLGELGLDGSLRPTVGTLPMVAALDAPVAVVPRANVTEARLVGREVRGVAHLRELVAVLRGDEPWPPPPPPKDEPDARPDPELAEVRGQVTGKRIMEIAAAGGHHVLMVGPPGAGKTMLASRLPALLPDLGDEAALEASRIHSAAGERLPASGLIRRPPFRAPHHSSSALSLIGGGSGTIRPGEVSLAHGGCLFLDELGEFAPTALEGLRQPLEEGRLRVARVRATVDLPARFILVAATNPCPCGNLGTGVCTCSEAARARYARRLSGPLLDRFDLRLRVIPPTASELFGPAPPAGSGATTAEVRRRVEAARARAEARSVTANRELRGDRLAAAAPLSSDAEDLLRSELSAGRLSARGAERVRAVALTISDLDGLDGPLCFETVAEALAYRMVPEMGERAA